MPPTISREFHALLPSLEPPCGCSPNYSAPVSCSATALLHSCLCMVKQREKKHIDWRFSSNSTEVRKIVVHHSPSPPLERKEMKQLKDKDGHSRSSSNTALCSQRVKVFCAKAEGGRVLGNPSRWFHSKEFSLDLLRKAKGLTIYRPLQEVEALHTALSEEREAPIFVDIITKPCITLHRVASGKLLARGTLPRSRSQPEKPVRTSRLHMASQCSGIQRKVYIIPHRGADVGFPEQQ